MGKLAYFTNAALDPSLVSNPQQALMTASLAMNCDLKGESDLLTITQSSVRELGPNSHTANF